MSISCRLLRGHSGSILYAVQDKDGEDGDLYALGMLHAKFIKDSADRTPTEYTCTLLWPSIERVLSKNGMDIANYRLAGTEQEDTNIDIGDFKFKRDERVDLQ